MATTCLFLIVRPAIKLAVLTVTALPALSASRDTISREASVLYVHRVLQGAVSAQHLESAANASRSSTCRVLLLVWNAVLLWWVVLSVLQLLTVWRVMVVTI